MECLKGAGEGHESFVRRVRGRTKASVGVGGDVWGCECVYVCVCVRKGGGGRSVGVWRVKARGKACEHDEVCGCVESYLSTAPLPSCLLSLAMKSPWPGNRAKGKNTQTKGFFFSRSF